MNVIWEKKYFHGDNIILYRIFSDGSHEIIVNDEAGKKSGYEEISTYMNYMGLTDYLSPNNEPMILHLEDGQL